MNPGTDWIEQGRRLLDTLRSRPPTPPGGRRPGGTPPDCRWCPVCQVAAVVRGERPEVTAALADVLTATATALRTFAADGAGAPAGAGADGASREETTRRRPSSRSRSRDRPRRGRAAPRSASTSAARRSPAASSRPTARSWRPPAGRPRAPRSSDTEDAIAAVVEELAGRARRRLVGVGIGAAGWIDRTGDTVLFSPHLAWRNATLRKDLAARLQRPLWVGNDANAAAWAEYRYGAARGARPGADDHPRHRHRRRHRARRPAAPRRARRRGGVGPHAGRARRPALRLRQPRLLGAVRQRHRAGQTAREVARTSPAAAAPAAGAGRTATPDRLTGEDVARAAADGDPPALELVTEVGVWLGQGIADLAAVLDPRSW